LDFTAGLKIADAPTGMKVLTMDIPEAWSARLNGPSTLQTTR
jgi:hypothetical protein